MRMQSKLWFTSKLSFIVILNYLLQVIDGNIWIASLAEAAYTVSIILPIGS